MDIFHQNDPAGFVAGVPVKITAKFRPPPRVVLSASCNHSVNVQILTSEHEFRHDEHCLNWISEYKATKLKTKQDREAKITEYDIAKKERIDKELEEAEREKKEQEEKLKNDNGESETADKSPENSEDGIIPAENNGEPDEDKIRPNEDHSSDMGFNKNEPIHNVNNPIPLANQHIASNPLPSANQQVVNFPYSISPNASISQPPHSHSGLIPQGSVLIPQQINHGFTGERRNSNKKSNINIAEFETVASDPFDTAALNSINDMEELAQVLGNSNLPYQDNPVQNYTNLYQNHYNVNGGMPTNNLYNYYKPLPQSQFPYGANYMPAGHNVNVQQQEKLPAQVPPNQSYNPVPIKPSEHSNYNGIKYNNPQPQLGSYGYKDEIAAPYKRQDLEDFYSKYYGNKKSESSGSRSGSQTPTSALTSNLRPSSSVPDLTLEDNEVSHINNTTQKVSTTGTRSSSTGFPIQEIYVENSKNMIKLSDPFGELDPHAQELVQNMAEMGFPRARVSRAVQKLGHNHKKLIEVLLALQDFQESGENEYIYEMAFYYFMGDLDKVKEILPTSRQLIDLGFRQDKVFEAILKTENDYNKAIGELVANTAL